MQTKLSVRAARRAKSMVYADTLLNQCCVILGSSLVGVKIGPFILHLNAEPGYEPWSKLLIMYRLVAL